MPSARFQTWTLLEKHLGLQGWKAQRDRNDNKKPDLSLQALVTQLPYQEMFVLVDMLLGHVRIAISTFSSANTCWLRLPARYRPR